MIFSLAHWTEAAWVTQGQQGLSSGPSPGCEGTIHLAQLPPFKPYSGHINPEGGNRGGIGHGNRVRPFEKAGRPLGFLGKTSGGLQVFAQPLCPDDTCPQVPPLEVFPALRPQAGLQPLDTTVMAYCPQSPVSLAHP